jgi:hypothetical protein
LTTKPAGVQVNAIKEKIEALLKQAGGPSILRPLADEARRIIVKRTRLGFGVLNGQKVKLRASGKGGGFSESYLKARIRAKRRGSLSPSTNPKKLNLTFTGQMLESTSVIKAKDGIITIAPTGTRKDGKKNADIAFYNAQAGRNYLGISKLEFQQLLRFYRKSFTDLRKRLAKLR